ncbi:MAG: hypothetical protein IJ083_03640 [Clostridia bacterium]|nr:hypothetical protein [Clostridia bacterium]
MKRNLTHSGTHVRRLALALLLTCCLVLLTGCMGNGSPEDWYNIGRQEMSLGHDEAALEAFQKAGHTQQSDLYIRYLTAWGLAREGRDLEAAEAFEGLGDFLDSREEAASFRVRQVEKSYQTALNLFYEKRWGEAQEALRAFEDREDVPNLIRYAEAMELRDEAPDSAIGLFLSLGSWRDSRDQAERLEKAMLEGYFQAALREMDKADWDAGIRALETLIERTENGIAGPEEAFPNLDEAKQLLSYAEAQKVFSEGDWLKAESMFRALGFLRDSRAMAELSHASWVRDMQKDALSLEGTGDFEAALSILEALGSEADPFQVLRVKVRLMEGEDRFEEAVAMLETRAEETEDNQAQVEALLEEVRGHQRAHFLSEGIQAFEKGDMETASLLLSRCEDMQEAENYLLYLQALEYLEAGDAQDARDLFEGLGDFADAQARAEALREAWEEDVLKRAVEAYEDGNEIVAVQLFSQVSGREEAQRYLVRMQAALQLLHGDWDSSARAFEELGDDALAKELLQSAEYMQARKTYTEALSAIEEGDMDRAEELMAVSSMVSESAPYRHYFAGKKALEREAFDEAARELSQADGVLDTEELLLAVRKAKERADVESAIRVLEEEGTAHIPEILYDSDDVPEDMKAYVNARALETEDPETAIELYRQVGDVLDAADRTEALEERVQAERLGMAVSLARGGALQEALDLVADDPGDDAEMLRSYCRARLMEEQDTAGSREEAADIYEELGDYLDVPERIRHLDAIAWREAMLSALRDGNLEGAAHLLEDRETLSGEGDADAWMTYYLQGRMLEEEGRYGEAAASYLSLLDLFLDAGERYETVSEQAEEADATGVLHAFKEGNVEPVEDYLAPLLDGEMRNCILHLCASRMMDEGRQEDAQLILGILGEQADADATETDEPSQLVLDERWDEAREAFLARAICEDEETRKDADRYLLYIEARVAENRGSLHTAAKLYELLTDFLDSRERLAKAEEVLDQERLLYAPGRDAGEDQAVTTESGLEETVDTGNDLEAAEEPVTTESDLAEPVAPESDLEAAEVPVSTASDLVETVTTESDLEAAEVPVTTASDLEETVATGSDLEAAEAPVATASDLVEIVATESDIEG